jgi:hypothetical protein
MSTDNKNWKKKLSKVAENLIEAENGMQGWEDNIKISDKNLEVCCVEHASWLAYYDEIATELKYTIDYIQMIEDQVRGELYKYIRDNSQKTHSETSIKMILDSNPEYIEIHEIYLLAQERYLKCVKVVKAFEQRSYMLNNIVKIREKELENVIIRT